MTMECNKIVCCDCLDLLKNMDDGCCDLLLQDMPYGVTQNEWDVMPDLDVMWKEWLRVAKDNAAFVFTASQPFVTDLINSNRAMFRYDLVWYKPLGTGFLNANRMPMRNHESILIFYRSLPTFNPQMGVGLRKKGNRKHDRNGTNYGRFATEGSSNYFDDEGKRFPQSVIEISNGDRTIENDHPTQKPLDLIRYLVLTFSNENELVFDGYAGSGTTAIACIIEKRNYLCAEISTEYHALSEQRITSQKNQTVLF